jgi:hypothetical protein
LIKIPITRDLAHKAALMAEQIPENIRNSIEKGRNRFIGCLGEAALIEYLESKGSQVKWLSTGDYDLISNGKKLEVKTKKTKVEPLPNYECSVACYNTKQECDYYVFTRAAPKFVYILGYISPKELYQKGRKMKKGEKDTNMVGDKQFEFKADCINIYIGELNKF